jgi:phage terminase large subunit GpA-like protein
MIRDHPTLKERARTIAPYAKAEKLGTVRQKRYPGGFLNILTANSASGLSSRPVPLVLMDEVDRCIRNASREGNPTRLLTARASTFADRKEIFVSSPVLSREEAGIVAMYEDSSREEWQLLCPNPECGAWHFLQWASLDLESALYACPECGLRANQWQWQEQPGRWLCNNPTETRTRGFRINGLISPWLSWSELVAEYRAAKKASLSGDQSLLATFTNLKLGEPFSEVGKRIEIDLYGMRREVYGCHAVDAELPDGVLVLICGVDVQDSFLSYEIVGWGKGRESWGIETGQIQGDPRPPTTKVWDLLDQLVYKRVLSYSDGARARVRLIFVDSGGHCTPAVYAYTKARHPRVFAIKGVPGSGTPIIVGAKRRERAEGVWIVRLGVDTLKEEGSSRLSVEEPGAGYCHFPMREDGHPSQGYTPEYFAELLAERRSLRYSRGGFARYEWTKNRTAANEALDCRNYARAALEYAKVPLDRMRRDELYGLRSDDIEELEIGVEKRISFDRRSADTVGETAAPRYGAHNVPSFSTGPHIYGQTPARESWKYGARHPNSAGREHEGLTGNLPYIGKGPPPRPRYGAQ